MRAVKIENEAAMMLFGAALAGCITGQTSVHIAGPLGAGKTTLCRGIIRAMGHAGAVKSPTFTLVEPYEIQGRHIFHFDLYRLNDPRELEYIGVDEYFDAQSCCLIEWPERAAGQLPPHDLDIQIALLEQQREVYISANSQYGERICQQLTQKYI